MSVKNKKIKLSDKQKDVIRAMRKGAHIVKMETFEGTAYLSSSGFNRFNLNTWSALLGMGIIFSLKRGFPSSKYILTELGKTIEL